MEWLILTLFVTAVVLSRVVLPRLGRAIVARHEEDPAILRLGRRLVSVRALVALGYAAAFGLLAADEHDGWKWLLVGLSALTACLGCGWAFLLVKVRVRE